MRREGRAWPDALTALVHADFVALAKATRLAALAAVLVDGALVGRRADVIILSC